IISFSGPATFPISFGSSPARNEHSYRCRLADRGALAGGARAMHQRSRRTDRNPPVAIPDDAAEAITRCLSAESKTIRRRAADALAAIARRDSRILATLRAALHHTDRQTRFGAAYALGASGDGALTIDAAHPLYDALGDRDGDVRWAAAELVVRLGRAHPVEIPAGLLALVREGNPAARK